MTTLYTAARTRNIVAAVLAGGLLTSLSACGGSNSSTSTAPVSESQPIQGSPMVACGMAQLMPRVADGDPMLARAQDFFTEMEKSQAVPPAVQKVYSSDVSGLNPDQKHEVLLMLSSLNECPGLTPELQQSVLAAFDQLAPQTVAVPSSSDDTSDNTSASSGASSGAPVVVIRSDDTAVEDTSTDHVWFDGRWDGHPWWFRPTWDHPITDTADWVQWGHDRREGVVWRWEGSSWHRIGRQADSPADRPWLPRVVGPGRLDHDPNTGGGNNPVLPGVATPLPMPGQSGVPQVPVPHATASGSPNVTAPQVTRPDFGDRTNSNPGRPDFGNPRPDSSASQPGTSGGASTSKPSAAPDLQQPTRTNTDTNGSTTPGSATTHSDTSTNGHSGDSSAHGNGSTSTSDTTTDKSSDSAGGSTSSEHRSSTATPAPHDRTGDTTRGSVNSDATGTSHGVSPNSGATGTEQRRHDPNAG